LLLQIANFIRNAGSSILIRLFRYRPTDKAAAIASSDEEYPQRWQERPSAEPSARRVSPRIAGDRSDQLKRSSEGAGTTASRRFRILSFQLIQFTKIAAIAFSGHLAIVVAMANLRCGVNAFKLRRRYRARVALVHWLEVARTN